MDGKYHIDLAHIRALALECHAYDIQFDALFINESICGGTEAIYRAYNRSLSTALLNLAISIRVGLSDHPAYNDQSYANPAAIFLEGGKHADGAFSIKDICDKFIHAQKIYKPRDTGTKNAGVELSGDYHGKRWVLGVGVAIFCEYVLKWLDEIEASELQRTAS